MFRVLPVLKRVLVVSKNRGQPGMSVKLGTAVRQPAAEHALVTLMTATGAHLLV